MLVTSSIPILRQITKSYSSRLNGLLGVNETVSWKFLTRTITILHQPIQTNHSVSTLPSPMPYSEIGKQSVSDFQHIHDHSLNT